jgi:hypothetical protein
MGFKAIVFFLMVAICVGCLTNIPPGGFAPLPGNSQFGQIMPGEKIMMSAIVWETPKTKNGHKVDLVLDSEKMVFWLKKTQDRFVIPFKDVTVIESSLMSMALTIRMRNGEKYTFNKDSFENPGKYYSPADVEALLRRCWRMNDLVAP